jgi:glycosyltransferase involved in cell wall biosynthesis
LGAISVVYIISNINKSLAFEWIAEELDGKRFSLAFILLNPADSALEQKLRELKIETHRITYTGKKDLPAAIFQSTAILKKLKPAAIHCHLFDACLAGLIAGRLAGVKQRIYTRHHSTLHHEYFPRAVWYDKFINGLATDIVAISENVKQVLTDREGVRQEKITMIHHGFRLGSFRNNSAENVQSIRHRYRLNGHFPVVGVISRYTQWKGIQYIIPAFRQLLQHGYPKAKLILANASGDYKTDIQKLLAQLPPDSYTEILFEEQITSLYQALDVFVHTPVNDHSEAFGQTYVEALATGVPSVFTLSGVAPEFVEHCRNALLVPFKDEKAIFEAVKRLLEDEGLRNKLVQQGQEDVDRSFSLRGMISKLERLYED